MGTFVEDRTLLITISVDLLSWCCSPKSECVEFRGVNDVKLVPRECIPALGLLLRLDAVSVLFDFESADLLTSSMLSTEDRRDICLLPETSISAISLFMQVEEWRLLVHVSCKTLFW